MPLISVIVTAYNIEAYIEECLRSVVGQTLADMEIIVVDDGSSDATPEIIRRFAAEDARIRPIFLPENTIGGVASAANAGLDAATGDWVGFVDGDDYLAPDMFEALVGAATEAGADLAMCRYLEAVGPEKTLREPAEQMRWVKLGDVRRVSLETDENRRKILRFIAVPWRKIYRRALLEDNGIRFPVVDYFWEDNPFHWFAVCSAEAIAVVPRVLCYHRVGRAGQTMDTRNADLLKMFGHYETIRSWLEKRDLLGRYHATLLDWTISQFQWIHKRIPAETGGALYDVMAGIVGPVDQAVFDRALAEKRPRIRSQMRNIRAGDRAAFLRYFDSQFTERAQAVEMLKRKVAKPAAFVRLGVGHVRANGLGPTVRRALQKLGDGRVAGVLPRRKTALTEEQMLTYMALLERDMDRRHAEQMARLEAIEAALRSDAATRGEE